MTPSCVSTAAPLFTAQVRKRDLTGDMGDTEMRYYGYHRRSGAIAGIVIGTIILLIGFSFLVRELYNVSIPWFEVLIILLGIYIIARALTGRGRRR